MSITWTETTDGVDREELAALYRAAPLGDKPPGELELVFTNSRYVCFLHDGGRLVGAGRALADGRDCSYICDVALLPDYQGRGLGAEIVGRLVERSEGHKKIILYSVPGTEPFYERFGFRRMTTAMAIFDDSALAAQRGYLEPDPDAG
ncbi:MAG: GNAT family N-acetyltransferase [Magnetovibrio sp.]|nr:GNAT family N-acetyltransferase [Magnetovibrio sp.]